MAEEVETLNQRDLRDKVAFLVHELEKFDIQVRTEDHAVFQSDPKLVEDVKTLLQKMESIRNYFAYVN